MRRRGRANHEGQRIGRDGTCETASRGIGLETACEFGETPPRMSGTSKATKSADPAHHFDYDPAAMLDALTSNAPKRFPFTATTPAEARKWQGEARAAVAKLLGFLDLAKVPP